MSFFSKYLGLVTKKQNEWHHFIAVNNLQGIKKSIVKDFYLKDDLDFSKWVANNNLETLLINQQELSFMDRLNYKGRDSKLTPTYDNCYSDEYRESPPNIPTWFLCGYPDVVYWFYKNVSNSNSEVDKGILHDYESNNNSEFEFFRKLIENYKKKTGKVLECY